MIGIALSNLAGRRSCTMASVVIVGCGARTWTVVNLLLLNGPFRSGKCAI